MTRAQNTDSPLAAGSLSSLRSWNKLEATLSGGTSLPLVHAILQYLKGVGCRSYLVEEIYIDRDHSSDFSYFYSTTFKLYSKVCKRIHFFSVDISKAATVDDPIGRARLLSEAGQRGYLGFLVVRPLPHAPIGRTVLSFQAAETGELCVRASYDVHVAGTKLTVEGVPFLQQDRRVSTCAHVAVWICGRHAHQRHREHWFSVSDISELASDPMGFEISTSVPTGCVGLSPDPIVRAVSKMGLQPLLYCPPRFSDLQSWSEYPYSRVDIINRYVDSGLPVILLLSDKEEIGHAVTIIGQRLSRCPTGILCTSSTSDDRNRPPLPAAAYCEHFIVHDDSRGVYLKLGLAHSSHEPGWSPYSVLDHGCFIIVPLPEKVFLPAEVAGELAWAGVTEFVNNWQRSDMSRRYSRRAPDSQALVQEFLSRLASDQIGMRTYLTTGVHYKTRLLSSGINASVANAIVLHNLSRMVWVAELFSNEEGPLGNIWGHIAIDATSSHTEFDNILVMHVPGFLLLNDVIGSPASREPRERDYNGDGIGKTMYINADKMYSARLRDRSPHA